MPMTLPPGTEFEPMDDTIFCRLYAQTGKYKSNSKLWTPEVAREEIFMAQVLRVGPGRRIDVDAAGADVRLPMRYAPGDDVVFTRYHGERVEIDDGFYIVLKEDDVLMRVTVPEDQRDVFYKWAVRGDVEDRFDAPMRR